MSKLDIRYIASLSDCRGQDREHFDAAGARLDDRIFAFLVARGETWQPRLSERIPVLAAVNQQMATSESGLQSNDEIDFSRQSWVVNEIQVGR